jgi:ELWxxDGT repeat protein
MKIFVVPMVWLKNLPMIWLVSVLIVAADLAAASTARAQTALNCVGHKGTTVCSYSFVIFAGTDTAGERGVWLSDGTVAGTHEVVGIIGANAGGLFGGRTGFSPDFTVFNNKVLFSGLDAAGNIGLWVTNGTGASTYELTGITGASSGGLNPSDFTVFNGKVLFNGYDSAGFRGLWVTDGTAAGTYELTGISGAFTGGAGLGPSEFTDFNGEVFFEGTDAAYLTGLWVTDGTAAGTHEITVPGGIYGFGWHVWRSR